MSLAIGILLWAAVGYSGWYVQIKSTGGHVSGYDAVMVGPMMLLGPIGLLIVLMPPRS